MPTSFRRRRQPPLVAQYTRADADADAETVAGGADEGEEELDADDDVPRPFVLMETESNYNGPISIQQASGTARDNAG